MAPQRQSSEVSALLRAGHKVSEVAILVGLAQPSTGSRSAWMMAKVSTAVQVVVESLLWIITACGMSFEELAPKCSAYFAGVTIAWYAFSTFYYGETRVLNNNDHYMRGSVH